MADGYLTVDTYDPIKGKYSTGYVFDGKTYTDQAGTQRISDGTYVRGPNGTLYQYTGGQGVIADLTGETNPFDPNYNGFGTVGVTPTSKIKTESGGQSGGIGGQPGGVVSFDQDQMINDIYNAQIEAKKAALDAAYQQNVNAANAARAAIPETYNVARNSAASQSAIGQLNFNEKAAASGLNSGTGSQATLAMNNTLQSNLSDLDRQQAKDISAVDLQLAQIKAKYEGDIAAAIADGQFQKAQALYSKYMTDQQNALEQKRFDAQMSASNDAANYARSIKYAEDTGDYSSMSLWWTHQAIKNAVDTFAATMRQQKSSANEIAAYLTRVVRGGAISQQEAAEILQSLGLTNGG